jgi:hypothetical protein
MEKEFSNLHGKEKVHAENSYLKMKLMLEKGAQFGPSGLSKASPDEENRFLKDIIEFESQVDQQKMIRVFDRIGRPTHFRPASQIPDHAIDDAWRELANYLFRYGVSIGVCSPNVSIRELYRFAVEELFYLEMEDVRVPNVIYGFVYDSYHPDPVYEKMRLALEDCIIYILSKEATAWTEQISQNRLRLNEHYPLSLVEMKQLIDRFKSVYEDLQLREITEVACEIGENESQVTGKYLLIMYTGVDRYELRGTWKVDMQLDKASGIWFITGIYIENIRF